jgi:hypothetical protein
MPTNIARGRLPLLLALGLLVSGACLDDTRVGPRNKKPGGIQPTQAAQGVVHDVSNARPVEQPGAPRSLSSLSSGPSQGHSTAATGSAGVSAR